MLNVQDLTLTHQRDLRLLVDHLSFTLSGRDRLAVIGEEGDGKSTLLKAVYDPRLIASYAAMTGRISATGECLGYLPQEVPATWQDQPVCTVLGLWEGFQALSPGEQAQLCRTVGVPPDFPYAEWTVRQLSGGERVRLMLMRCLCARPSLLLLDEPGNDLDIPSLRFLERFIQEFPGSVLFISHDETLLSRTATRVLHLEMAYRKTTPRATLSNTPYPAYMAAREAALVRQEAQAQMEKRERAARQERFLRIYQAVEYAQNTVSRQDPGTGRLLKKKMKTVKSLEKRFEREDERQTERPNVEYPIDAVFQGDHTLPAGKRCLDVTLPLVQAGDRVLARNVTLRLTGGEKVLIVGPNGCGKTTLLREIARSLLCRTDVRAGYMPQRYEDVLPLEKTPIDFLHTRGDREQLTRLRTYLGAFKFTTPEMEHPMSALSGGQKAKVLLLSLLLSDANVLIADEPTRNLSPLSAPVVRRLLCGFEGCVLGVTHDRTLLQMWPGRILLFTPEGLQDAPPEMWS